MIRVRVWRLLALVAPAAVLTLAAATPAWAALAPGTPVTVTLTGPGGTRTASPQVGADGTVTVNFPINSFGEYRWTLGGQPPMSGTLTVGPTPVACSAASLQPDTACAGVTHSPLPGDTGGNPSYITIAARFAAPPTPTPASTPTPTAPPTPTAAPTAAPTSAPTQPVAAGGPPWPAIAIGLVLLALLVFVAVMVRARRGIVVAVADDPCAEARRAEAEARAARDRAAEKLRALEAVRSAWQAAQAAADKARAEWESWRKQTGAKPWSMTGESAAGTTAKSGWHYAKGTSQADQQAADGARARAEAADVKAKSAKEAFEKAGGEAAYAQAKADFDASWAVLDRAVAALERCQGTPGDSAGGTAVDGPKTSGDVPHTQEKPPDPCAGKPDRTVVVCEGFVYSNELSRAKVTNSGYYSGSDNVKDLVAKFNQAKEYVDIGLKLEGAVTDPIGSIADTMQTLAQAHHKLPPSQPGNYTDLMLGAVPQALDGLADKMKKHEMVGEYTVSWPRHKYHYRGTVVCACRQGAYAVVSRDFHVEPAEQGFTEIIRRDVQGGETLLNQKEVEKGVRAALIQPIRDNERAEATLRQMQQKVDEAGCG